MPWTAIVSMWQNAYNWGWWVRDMQWFLFVLFLFFVCCRLCCDNLICGEVVLHDWCLVVVVIVEGIQRFCKLVLEDSSDGAFGLHLYEERWNSLKATKYHNAHDIEQPKSLTNATTMPMLEQPNRTIWTNWVHIQKSQTVGYSLPLNKILQPPLAQCPFIHPSLPRWLPMKSLYFSSSPWSWT